MGGGGGSRAGIEEGVIYETSSQCPVRPGVWCQCASGVALITTRLAHACLGAFLLFKSML